MMARQPDWIGAAAQISTTWTHTPGMICFGEKRVMKALPLATRALALLQKTHKRRRLALVNSAVAVDAKTGERIHEFIAVAPDDPNGSSFCVVLAADGSPRDHLPAPETPILPASARLLSTSARAPITIQPDTNMLSLGPNDTVNEALTVTVPNNATLSIIDVYFLADTTGSMGSILAAVQTGAGQILSTLGGLRLNVAFGVGNYKDFPPPSPSPFTHQLTPTPAAASVTAAIAAWVAAGGGDRPEGQLLALDQLAQPASVCGEVCIHRSAGCAGVPGKVEGHCRAARTNFIRCATNQKSFTRESFNVAST